MLKQRKGKAEQWIKPKLYSFYNNKEDIDDIFSNYSDFNTKIRRVFRISNKESTAERII